MGSLGDGPSLRRVENDSGFALDFALEGKQDLLWVATLEVGVD